MSSFIIPLAMVIAAGGLFLGYIAPAYEAVKVTRAETQQYEQALERFEELKQVRDSLEATYSTAFSADEIEKLLTILPDNLDNIRFALDLDTIATKNGVKISSLEIAEEDVGQAPALDANGNPIDETLTLGSSQLKFSLEGNYLSMINFLKDLEKNLRLVDIVDFTFAEASESSASLYEVEVRMYWLK